MQRLLVINGPNLNMLGIREPEIYGTATYRDLVSLIKSYCEQQNLVVKCFQANCEGSIIDEIQHAYGMYDGIIINAGGYTHTSVAIPDAISAVGIPAVEVHISDITKREPFRRHSYLTPVCKTTIMGLGFDGYLRAVDWLVQNENKGE